MLKSNRSRNLLFPLAVAVATCVATASPVLAAESATANVTFSQLNATTWHYDLTLNNTGTTNIGTFWFAWVPGEDLMPTSPTNITDPASWTDLVTGGGAGNGSAIQWTATSPGGLLASGNSLTGFGFDSATTPQQMGGASSFFEHLPVTTSFVYTGAPFSDAGVQFTATVASVPEPSSLILMLAGAGCLGAWAIRRRESKAV